MKKGVNSSNQKELAQGTKRSADEIDAQIAVSSSKKAVTNVSLATADFSVDPNANELEQITQWFSTLMNKNIHYRRGDSQYQDRLERAYVSGDLAVVFAVLEKANVPYRDNAVLCFVIIKNIFYAQKFSLLFEIIKKTKLSYQEHPFVYHAFIDQVEYANKLEVGFTALTQAKVPYEGDAKFCESVVEQAYCADKLAGAFATLEKASMPYEENIGLYKALIHDMYHSDTLAQGFARLKEGNISQEGNTQALYDALITSAINADKLAQGFAVLTKGGIPYEGRNIYLYKDLMRRAYQVFPLADAFVMLKKANISYDESQELFHALNNNAERADKLALGFVALKEANIPQQEKEILFTVAMVYPASTMRLSQVLSAIARLGMSYQNSPEVFHVNLLLTHVDLSIFCLDKLYQAGFLFPDHEKYLHSALKNLTLVQVNHEQIITIITRLCDYAKNNSVPQLQDLEMLLSFSPNDLLTSGPLNKSEATIQIELLLEQLSRVDCENHRLLCFIEPETYFLQLPGQNKVNLSLLIRNANLTQLTLSNDLIARLGNILKNLGIKWDNVSDNRFVQLLPEAQIVAINLYITPQYKNINAFFRAEPLDTSHKLCSQDQNMLACFLVGCLLNDAANKIQVLPWQIWEDFSPSSNPVILDRGESLSDEIIKRRTSNAWTFPALTSFSALKEGSAYFNKPGTTRTKFQMQYPFVIQENEGEVIFAQGEQVVTVNGPDYLLSMIKRSPTLDPKNHYFSHLALEYAYLNYLSKEYRESSSLIEINGKSIVRPNHGLVHTYCVMLAVEHVVYYFAQYARDSEFKEFCQLLTDEALEWLRVAAAFSITGRESEIRAKENLERYFQYRLASAEHFMRFVKETTKEASPAFVQRMQDIICYMGNPHYEAREGLPSLNNHPEAAERKTRNFLHRILTIAHKLNLPRCYHASEFAQAIEPCHTLSEPSESQQNALIELIRYNIAVLKACGSRLICDIQMNGELVNAQQPCQEIFAEASTSLKRLFEITETVRRPLITPSFQLRARA